MEENTYASKITFDLQMDDNSKLYAFIPKTHVNKKLVAYKYERAN